VYFEYHSIEMWQSTDLTVVQDLEQMDYVCYFDDRAKSNTVGPYHAEKSTVSTASAAIWHLALTCFTS